MIHSTKANNHVCHVCGRTYQACDSCERLKEHNIFAYRILYDTADCFQISEIIAMHSRGTLSDADAIEMLSQYDLASILVNDTDAKAYIDKLNNKVEPVEVTLKKRLRRPKTEEA